MPDQSPDLRALLVQLNRAWCRLGVSRNDRRRLEAELVPDLQAAAADGNSLVDLLTPDIDTFAKDVAEAHGVRQVPPRHASVQLGGLVGAIVALAIGAAAAAGLHAVLTPRVELSGRHPVAGPVLVFSLVAVAGLVGCLLGVHAVVRGESAAGATVRRAALVVPLATAAGVGLAVALGKLSAYSDTPAIVLAECGLVIVSCAGGLASARRSALAASGTWARSRSHQ